MNSPISKSAVGLALLVSGKVSLFAAIAIYNGFVDASSISTFSSGGLTFGGLATKTRDYAALLAFVTVALLVFGFIYEVLLWSSRRVPDGLVTAFWRAIIMANIPAFYALGQLIFSKILPKTLIGYSIAAELVVVLCFAAFQIRREFDPKLDSKEQTSNSVLNWVLPVLLFSIVAGAATPLSWNLLTALKAQTLHQIADFVRISNTGANIAFVIASAGCIIVCSLGRENTTERGGYLMLAAAQILLLAGAVRLQGPLLLVDNKLQQTAALTTMGQAIVVLVVLWSIVSILRSAWRVIQAPKPEHWMKRGYTITPLAVALLVFFVKVALDIPRLDLADEYHTGEFVVPYWAYKTYGMLPYVDLAPARGLINLIYGWVAEEVMGGKYTSYAIAGSYVAISVFFIEFVALRWAIGPWPALFLTLLSPAANGISEIDVVSTVLLAVICRASFVVRPVAWIAIWVLLGTVAVLFAPGQGGLLVIATCPIGFVKVYEALNSQRRRLIELAIVIVLSLFALTIATPFLQITLGAVRYGLEQSQVNTEMNGVPWAIGTAPVSSALLWEILRSLWLFITIGIGASVYVELRRAGTGWMFNRHVMMGIAIVILGMLFIFRATGRIDPGLWTRLGLATDWFVLLLVPLYIFFSYRQRVSAWAIGAITALAGLINSLSNFAPSVTALDRLVAIPAVSSAALVDGNSVGLGRFGRGQFDRSLLDNYVNLKRFVDTEISPQDTFIDLTNRSSLHYLLDKPPPIEAAVYNLTNERQQARMVSKLLSNPPGYALAASNTIVHDGGSISLRTHLLYRFVIENYLPLERDGAIWLRHIAQPAQSNNTPQSSLKPAELSLMTRAFAQRDLGALPRIWGEAWNKLRHQIRDARPIDLGVIALHDVKRTNVESLVSIGEDPFFVVDLNNANIVGAKAGILTMEFECDGQPKSPSLQVYWTNELVPEHTEEHSVFLKAVSGRLVIPLDSAPSWVLGGRTRSLRISLRDGSACKEWRVSNLELAQRSSVARALNTEKETADKTDLIGGY